MTPYKETVSCNAHPQLWPIRLPMSVIATGIRAVFKQNHSRRANLSVVSCFTCLFVHELSASGTSRLDENDKQTHLYHLYYILEREM